MRMHPAPPLSLALSLSLPPSLSLSKVPRSFAAAAVNDHLIIEGQGSDVPGLILLAAFKAGSVV